MVPEMCKTATVAITASRPATIIARLLSCGLRGSSCSVMKVRSRWSAARPQGRGPARGVEINCGEQGARYAPANTLSATLRLPRHVRWAVHGCDVHKREAKKKNERNHDQSRRKWCARNIAFVSNLFSNLDRLLALSFCR